MHWEEEEEEGEEEREEREEKEEEGGEEEEEEEEKVQAAQWAEPELCGQFQTLQAEQPMWAAFLHLLPLPGAWS